jgi:hypothetical protein
VFTDLFAPAVSPRDVGMPSAKDRYARNAFQRPSREESKKRRAIVQQAVHIETSVSGIADMGTFNLALIGKVLFLLTVANGAPVLGNRILGNKMAFPIDRGLILGDGQPLFGKSKTIRGVVLALFVTTMFAPLVRLELFSGAIISAAAMTGDLFSSFLKRRLKIPPSSMAIGLDQIPEALLPALVARGMLPLTLFDIAAIVFAFLIAELLFSRLFFALKIRDQPY